MIKSEVKYRVLYAHTDNMGVVNNARYLEYFEAGRNQLLKNLGFPYTVLEKDNIGLPVIEIYCKYISAARYDDEVLIKSYLREIPTVRLKVEYEIFLEEKIIVTGYSIHSFVNFQKMKPIRPPENLIKVIREQV